MQTSDFDYDLPKELIAQRPAEPRDSSRLLVFHRETDRIEHRIFNEIAEYLSPNDVLVLNETKVFPARLRARKLPTGGAVEVLLLRRYSPQTWLALVGGKGIQLGQKLQIQNGPIAEVTEDLGGSRRLIHFDVPISGQLDVLGEMPVPPYIHTPLQNPDEYQTVFAEVLGSAAAPTAGLHFTLPLLETIRSKGTHIVKVLLHVGMDTFAPVNAKDPLDHTIHKEWCQVTPEAASIINHIPTTGGRVIAVGTTTVRTLETAARYADNHEQVVAFDGDTDLFILPGYQFRTIDGMLTNFHLPRSTLLMMVSAFTGRERLLEIYQQAIEANYRFYSFGDAMLIL
ncbi:MAG: tRNA preQ1(34) S-adenosylmethionine ribosyltransferase-isomerase QueA [Chloroflexi bacterium RBG_16_48_8]|nr:MAG: tRNA preQ1(34) S-adenosylmethionine ribosyltransferase-isomerase QueA [Chloroflexi bacterium RBG_16_48_8]